MVFVAAQTSHPTDDSGSYRSACTGAPTAKTTATDDDRSDLRGGSDAGASAR